MQSQIINEGKTRPLSFEFPMPCSGRSEEAAEVVFERREDAIAAVRKYNNLQLDNKPMKIELIEGGAGKAAGSRTLSSGIR